MFWYFLNIFSMVSIDFVANHISRFPRQENNNRIKSVCVIATINAIILSSLRDLSIGADTISYRNAFNSNTSLSWQMVFYNFYHRYITRSFKGDPGYIFIEKIFQILSTNYRWWLFFIACAIFVTTGKYIYRQSSDYLMSWILMFILFFSFYGTTGLRQTLAMAVVIWSLRYIKERKFIRYLLFVFLASTIHASALCVIPLYFIYRIKFTKKTILIYWALIVLSFLFREQLLSFLQFFVKYEGYGQYDLAGAPTFTALLFFLCIFISLFNLQICAKKKETEFYCNCTMFACIFSSLLLINPSLMRVVMYYDYFLIVLIPEFKNVFKKNGINIFRIIVIVICFLLFLKSSSIYKLCF